jgi:hypothetical protein
MRQCATSHYPVIFLSYFSALTQGRGKPAVIRRSLSSAGLLPLLLLMLCAVTLTFLWGLHINQKAATRQDALSAKAAEHLNLASIVGENLRQLVDRAQAVGRVTQDDMKRRQGNLSLARLLAEDPVFKRMSLYDRHGRCSPPAMPTSPSNCPTPGSTSSSAMSRSTASRPSCPAPCRRATAPCPTGACRSCCR